MVETEAEIPDILPVVAVRDLVVFPYMIVPLFVSRESSLASIEEALAKDRLVFLVTQKQPEADEPELDDVHTIGTVGTVIRLRKLPDGRTRVLVQGLLRGSLQSLSRRSDGPGLEGRVETFREIALDEPPLEVEAMTRNVRGHLEKLAENGRALPPDVMLVLGQINDPGRLSDLCAANLGLDVETSQRLLDELDPFRRLASMEELLVREMQLAEMQAQIRSQAREEISRTQREYYLREQLRQIQQELGESDAREEEIRHLTERVESAGLPAHAREEADRQLKRLQHMPVESAESSVVRTYLEWVADLPWNRTSEDLLDLRRARRVLDEDHYDLEEVKERILDHLAVRKLKPDGRGSILCFSGPPGVGKTSLGRSIARALGRQFARVSLGGVRDEAEIRGHRRTYVGALPGRILQALRQAGTRNPVVVLDELDKIGSGGDFRGDPYAALLEVLDPEQNATFRDHYLDLDYDLSHVLFIATANLLDTIPPPLRDRMEVIHLSGYTDEDKLRIAQRHTVPKQLFEHGLTPEMLSITDAAIERIVSGWTREAGLRGLEREVARICRKVARQVAEKGARRNRVSVRDVPRFLGPPRHTAETEMETDAVGEATGLAWTAAGGELLRIEASAMRGKSGLLLTGQLGDVMKESAHAALTWTRSNAHRLGIDESFFPSHEIHVHVPAGAIPKDGPSAGITIAAALVSLATNRAVRRDVAMTGELSLRGRVLPVGGLKEKLLAALRTGISTVVLPRANLPEVEALPPAPLRKLKLVPVATLEEALEAALVPSAASKRRGSKAVTRRVAARRSD